MMDAMVDALEAAWELDPVRLENKLWDKIDSKSQVCYTSVGFKGNVEDLSNVKLRDIQPCRFQGFDT